MWSQSYDAERAVENLIGVKGVMNRITVKPPRPVTAGLIQQNVQRQGDHHATSPRTLRRPHAHPRHYRRSVREASAADAGDGARSDRRRRDGTLETRIAGAGGTALEPAAGRRDPAAGRRRSSAVGAGASRPRAVP